MFYVIVVLIILLVIGILFLIGYKKIKVSYKHLDMCVINLEEVLDNKNIVINNMLDVLNSKKLKDIKNYSDDLNILLKEKELFEERLEINKYLEGAGKKKASNSEVKKIIDSLNIIDEDLDGLKNYYNTYANIYNDYLDRGFFRFIYKLMHLEKKELFDVRKLEDYEILKN